MRFWDSSAPVPLLVEQASSSRVAAWVAGDEAMWCGPSLRSRSFPPSGA